MMDMGLYMTTTTAWKVFESRNGELYALTLRSQSMTSCAFLFLCIHLLTKAKSIVQESADEETYGGILESGR